MLIVNFAIAAFAVLYLFIAAFEEFDRRRLLSSGALDTIAVLFGGTWLLVVGFGFVVAVLCPQLALTVLAVTLHAAGVL